MLQRRTIVGEPEECSHAGYEAEIQRLQGLLLDQGLFLDQGTTHQGKALKEHTKENEQKKQHEWALVEKGRQLLVEKGKVQQLQSSVVVLQEEKHSLESLLEVSNAKVASVEAQLQSEAHAHKAQVRGIQTQLQTAEKEKEFLKLEMDSVLAPFERLLEVASMFLRLPQKQPNEAIVEYATKVEKGVQQVSKERLDQECVLM